MIEVAVTPKKVDEIGSVLGRERLEELQTDGLEARRLLAERTVWNINSTAKGGGVAEMLHHLIAYARGLGVMSAGW